MKKVKIIDPNCLNTTLADFKEGLEYDLVGTKFDERVQQDAYYVSDGKNVIWKFLEKELYFVETEITATSGSYHDAV